MKLAHGKYGRFAVLGLAVRVIMVTAVRGMLRAPMARSGGGPIGDVRTEVETEAKMQNSRKLVTAVILLGAILPALATAVHPKQANEQRSLNLVGEIMDSRCAIDGSHNKMMQENRTKTAKDCTLQCAKSGGSYVLFDPETKSVYQLDDQQKPERFAGQRVRVSGTYDEPSKTMHVESIESAK